MAGKQLMTPPDIPVNLVRAHAGETFMLGTVQIRVMEDGSNTHDRLGTAEFTVPPNTDGPPLHWHEMHDETFLVLSGRMRFFVKDGGIVDCTEGDYVTVPVRSVHTWGTLGEGCKFLNTFTPSYYINYFKILSQMTEEGKPMDKEINKKAMSYFATIGVD
ncbi:RmlC-like cupin [Annulohypoxylon stygium]|nr:RmlC-like cupin [Annulohypoxylon stygium]